MIGSRDPISGEWIDPDDAPEWTEEMFATAEHRVNGVVIRPATHKLGPGGKLVPVGAGRPKLDKPKRQITLRLDDVVVERFRATGPGWQSRINAILREAVGA